MIVNDNRFGLYNGANPLLREAQLKLDHWITAVKADHRHMRMIDKVVQDKPGDLQEGCYSKDATPVFIPETQVRETVRTTACNTLYPTNSFPREVAGADVAADIIKCQRKPTRSGRGCRPPSRAACATGRSAATSSRTSKTPGSCSTDRHERLGSRKGGRAASLFFARAPIHELRR
jgi:hypothetical protein